ncbi:NAD(P)/FAD-dependent oxidoreductase [Streptomyces albus]|nr:NAD(P)/FAD-dependent oxidoreductase [Streptomyces albus]
MGAGFAGLYALHRLRTDGFSVRLFEASDAIGGVWNHNRYPGARCDIESMDYSYGFSEEIQQEWNWSERYASQPEILRYLTFVADRLGLWDGITFGTRVAGADFDEDTARWTVRTEGGATVHARYLIMATGVLSTARTPDFPGRERFGGEAYHTGRWPRSEIDFTGKRVGVIGTGSSGVQLIPIVARQAAELTVFQRTPNFTMPAQNAPLAPDFVREWKATYAERRALARRSGFGHSQPTNPARVMAVPDRERTAEFERRWESGGLYMLRAFSDILKDEEGNELCAEFVRGKIAEIVRDPKTAEALTPRGFPFGTKRLCSGTGYYETYNRGNVRLVDVRRTPITEITETGLRTGEQEHPLDVLIYATGFDAMTGSFLGVDIRGSGGRPLREKWASGPLTYLGLTTAGFPNLFLLTAPGSPSVLSNMVISAEQHVNWVADCLDHLRRHGLRSIEARAQAELHWVAHVNEKADETLYPRADSWYVGANVPGKPRVFMPYVGGVGVYAQKCDEVAATGYEGFELR